MSKKMFLKILSSTLLLTLVAVVVQISAAAPGDLDPSFDEDGLVLSHVIGSEPSEDEGQALAVTAQETLPDGRIIVAGYSYQPDTGHDFALVRYLLDGSLDTAFGSGGRVTTDFSGGRDQAFAIALQTDGKIVLAGASSGEYGYDFALARYNDDGTLDVAFDGDGKLTTDFSRSSEYVMAVVVQQDSKIVAAGSSEKKSTGRDFALARYNSDGSLDSSFDGDGMQTTDFDGSADFAEALVIQPNGKIIAGGHTYLSGTGYDFALARYHADGVLDSSFDDDGLVTTDFFGLNDLAYDLVLQETKLVVAGRSDSKGTRSDFALARYDLDYGILDTTFNGDGKVTIDHLTFSNGAYGVAVQSSDSGDQIIAAGYTDAGAGGRDFMLVRFDKFGEFDDEFGIVTTDFGAKDTGFSVEVLPDRRIIVAGTTQSKTIPGDFAIARYLADGALDPAFGTDGRVTTDIGIPFKTTGGGSAMAIQPDGKILVAGYGDTGDIKADRTNFALARYLPDGSPDSAFGASGFVMTDFGPDQDDRATAVAIQSDGKIVVAGSSKIPECIACSDFAVARYNSDGSLDTTFGPDGTGKILQDLAKSHDDHALDVAIQPDGKIIVVGEAVYKRTVFAIVRYLPRGELDPAFDNDGIIFTDFNSYAGANAVVVLPDEKIIAGGTAKESFALACYEKNGEMCGNFGVDGKVVTKFRGAINDLTLLPEWPDWRIVAAGVSWNSQAFALAKYMPDGELDTLFGTNGIVTTDMVVDQYDLANALELQSDGKIVAAGECHGAEKKSDFCLARYMPDGNLDADFGAGGKIFTTFGKETRDLAYDVDIQPDDKIVAAGHVLDPRTHEMQFALARYLANRPPTADVGGPYLGPVNEPIVFDGSGSFDPDGDTLTYVWDFGDGSFAESEMPAHSFAVSDIYDVCLTVNDGYVDSIPSCTLAVIYNPEGGFVTGGGWIDSQAGAYEPHPSLTGKATFGFVSKYKKGADVPTGNTEFQFHAGDLNFHSNSYEWLVVTGGNYARFKGSGTINGEGDYLFMIWAGDGNPDSFRIKIWEEDYLGTETVVYDNGMDQPLGGGSIVIHGE